MDWNNLTGQQQKIVREAILHAFVGADAFDMFLAGELDKPPLTRLVADRGFDIQIFRLLQITQAEGWTDRLIDALQRERSDNSLVRKLPDAVRVAGAVTPERMKSRDFELERIVSGGGFSDIRPWAERLALIAGATCRIESPADAPHGTGILVSPDLVMTNYHVVERHIEGASQPRDIVCRFDYASDVSGVERGVPMELAGADGWVAAWSPYDKQADLAGAGPPDPGCLDYALLRLGTAAADRKPVLLRSGAEPVADTLPVLIVQHPGGTPLAMAIGKSKGLNENGTRFRYDADTLGGSSGSGVYNQKLELVALHHAGDPQSNIRASYNQGIPIGRIVESLASKALEKFWQ